VQSATRSRRHPTAPFPKPPQPSGEAVAFFIDDAEQFLALRGVRLLAGQKASHRRLHGCQWRAEVMRYGIQQRGFEALALPFRLRLAQLLHSPRAFNRDRHETAHRI